MSKLIRVCFLSFLCVISMSSLASEFSFQTPLEQAKWQVKTSPFGCQITHPITRFGYASLEVYPASKFSLSLVSDWYIKTKRSDADAQAIVSYPDWKIGYPKQVFSVPMRWVGTNKLNAYGDGIAHFLSGLENGLTWQFVLGDNKQFLLTASAIKTQVAAQKFLRCFYHLIPKPFSYIRNLNLYFANSSAKLTVKAEQNIEAIAAYYKVDKKISKIIVDGYTDSSGYHLANMALSKYRAENVTRRLIELGIPQRIILTRFHGDRIPVSNDKTKVGLSLNRRVHIWIIKGNTKHV